jgi:lipoprotein-releasing system permease protein
MARRSFSLMLAWRYLNPRRAMLSAVTLISVTGVLLGVLVLVVVMAVYAGLEREVKSRLLGFTPHIRLEYVPFGGFREPIADWRETAAEVAKKPGVQSATAFVQEYVLMVDMASRKRPVFFRGIDTEDKAQVEGIDKLLNRTDFPDSSADMGLDNRVVVSSIIARQFGLQPGDTVKFLSAQNLEEVERIDRITRRPPVREEFAPQIGAAKELLKSAFVPRDGKQVLSEDGYLKIYEPLYDIFIQEIREPEKEIIGQFLSLFDAEPAPDGSILLDPDVPAKAAELLAQLDTTDVEKMDAEILKTFKEIVLPKEATVIGVYQASQMALTPDVFMPLPLAQELAGLQGAVQGIAVRLDDAYQADQMATDFMTIMPEGWQAVTWITEFGDFSRLINQQRMMMYFALSFIILVSAFSMMAVMFTVTIQKRRSRPNRLGLCLPGHDPRLPRRPARRGSRAAGHPFPRRHPGHLPTVRFRSLPEVIPRLRGAARPHQPGGNHRHRDLRLHPLRHRRFRPRLLRRPQRCGEIVAQPVTERVRLAPSKSEIRGRESRPLPSPSNCPELL